MRAAKALLAIGYAPGDTVCILGFNRPEWTILDLACMCVGGVPAGIYTTCSPTEVQYIVHHAASRLVLVENHAQWEKIHAERERLPEVRHVVSMRGGPGIEDPLARSWDDFLAKGDGIDDQKVYERVDALEPNALATLIYTSGTTGPPKGVMLSHENLAWTARAAAELTAATAEDRSLSYLPLSHIAEQVFSIHVPVSTGASVYFAQSIEKVPEDLKEVHPTVFFAVPRIWEKFHAGISTKLAQATGAKKKIAAWAMSVGARVTACRAEGREIPKSLELQRRAADRLVFSKVKAAIGLDKARVCVSGAAPVAREVLEFLAGLDLLVQEVYGQSEDTGPTSFNAVGRTKLGSVGPAFPGVDVRIAKDDEILVRGPNVFLGYYKEPQATAETLVDGWLHSGDLGAFDRDGFLTITGRKKEILITAGGKNIAPKNIEAALKNHPLINEAVVIGDRRKFLTAIVTLDPDALPPFLASIGRSGIDAPHQLDEVRAEVQKAVDAANEELARVEQIKKFFILPRNFTVSDGELTPTLKVKRKVVHERWANEIESMYE